MKRLFSVFFSLLLSLSLSCGGSGGGSSPDDGGSGTNDDSSGGGGTSDEDDGLNSVWIKTIGGTGDDEGRDIAVDASGNVYIAGVFYSSDCDFDPDEGLDIHNNSSGSPWLFVTKINSDGSYAWTKTMSVNIYNPVGITVDNSGSVYVGGSFEGTADFDPDSGSTDIHVNSGGMDLFLTKLGSDGSYAWTKMIGNDEEYEYMLMDNIDLKTDSTGNIYVIGSYEGTVDFDPGEDEDSHTSAGLDIFLLKINNDGSYGWTKTMTTTVENIYYYYDEGNGLAIDGNDNIYLTGLFSGTVDFDPDEEEGDLHSSAGYGDIFVTKILSDGTYGWTRTMEGEGYDFGYAVAVDGNDNVYLTGKHDGNIDFDPGEGTDYFTTSGFFITKIYSDGSYGWTSSGGAFNWALGITVDADDNVFITGEGLFLINYSFEGEHVGTCVMGSSPNDCGYSLASDGSGNIYLTGSFSGTVDFDPGEDVSDYTSNGELDIFLLKIAE